MKQELIEKLKAAFSFDEVEAKIQVTTQDKTKGMAVFYIDSRAIQSRLDETLGPLNWKNQYTPWHGNAQLCGIALYCDERKEWIAKYDGSECSDIEPIKGGISDSFKRAAVLWGIGRYLYQIDGVWVEIEQRGKGSYIKDNQQATLKTAYEKAVARIFGQAAPPSQKSAPAPAPQNVQPPTQQAAQTSQTAPPPAQQTAPPPVQNTAPPAQAQQTQPPAQNETDTDSYTVHASTPSGKSSLKLELLKGGGGTPITAYSRLDDTIKAGSRLFGVQIERKQSEHGDYNMVLQYKVAA
jgi:hypothetical protein